MTASAAQALGLGLRAGTAGGTGAGGAGGGRGGAGTPGCVVDMLLRVVASLMRCAVAAPGAVHLRAS